MTGGGFGGCAVALVDAAAEAGVVQTIATPVRSERPD